MNKPTKTDIQKLLNKSNNVEVIQPSAFSNKQADIKKIQEALSKNAIIVILR